LELPKDDANVSKHVQALGCGKYTSPTQLVCMRTIP